MLKAFIFLCTYFLSIMVFADWSVHSVEGSTSLKKGQVVTSLKKVSAKAGHALVFKQGAEKWHIRFSSPSRVEISPFSEGLLVRLISGDVFVKATGKNKSSLSVEFSEWRMSKSQGELSVKVRGSKAQVRNVRESLWIKKADLSDAPQEIASATSFELGPNQDIFGFKTLATPRIEAQWGWGVRGRGPSSQSSKNSSLCAAPSGEYEQCAWKCMGQRNPRASRCDTGYSHVHCVRMTCTADGQWKWATLVPGGECDARSVRVDRCQ